MELFDTWKCHICGEERPNDKISVLSKPLVINGQPCGEENIRYCNDRLACKEGAQGFSFLKDEMITIFFVDDGQDFLQWDVNSEGEVIACRPCQGWVWVGTKVHNKDIRPGDQLDITTKDGTHRRMLHKVYFMV